jgi:hypothetical protein
MIKCIYISEPFFLIKKTESQADFIWHLCAHLKYILLHLEMHYYKSLGPLASSKRNRVKLIIVRNKLFHGGFSHEKYESQYFPLYIQILNKHQSLVHLQKQPIVKLINQLV